MKKKRDEIVEPYTGKTYLYIAIVLNVLAAIALGLSFTILGIYSLIASVLFSLCAITFCNIQKKKNNVKGVKIVTIIAYIIFVLELILFNGGIIYSAT
jgi:hypothetical protein